MAENRYFTDTTIAAVATPVGKGGIGIVRISGKDALDVLKRMFVPADGSEIGDHRVYYGRIFDEGKIFDRAIAIYMAAPHSYTGEDVVELQCHGGEKLLAAVLQLALKQGAVMATPGEFTLRAFMNGKIDLTQAEAIADIIDAKTGISLLTAQAQLGGALSVKFNAVEQKLLDLAAAVEVGVDFPDDEDALSRREALQGIDEICEDIERMLADAPSGRIYREGLRCVLIGEVNSGKSSLFNALLESDRAIVTDIPGTTRDTLEEYLDLEGVPVLLIDTAGLRQTAEKVEIIGIERSRQSAREAQMLLILIDGSKPLSEESLKLIWDYRDASPLCVITKADMPLAEGVEEGIAACLGGTENICRVSAASGMGLAELKRMILRNSAATMGPREGLINNLRHEQALKQTLSILDEARENLLAGASIDLLGIDLLNAYQKLGEITGKTAGQEVLNNIFSRFCLGK